ncbi:hypothetical protein GGX14DRAFT_366870, partial [Mycena pura]
SVNKYLASSKDKIPSRLRRLMRLVAEVVPRCATTSRKLALHILTTQQNKTQCRFHDIKRNTKAAKEVDKPGDIVGVAFSKSKLPIVGILDCGCDENAALWELFWFKTWSITSLNPGIQTFDRMRNDAGDVLNARQRGFFSQAYTLGSMLNIDDVYTDDPLVPFGSNEYYDRIREIQAHRAIFMLNATLPVNSGFQYVLAKKAKDGDAHMTQPDQ